MAKRRITNNSYIQKLILSPRIYNPEMSTSAFVLVKLKPPAYSIIKNEKIQLKNQLLSIKGVENVFLVEPGDSLFDAIVKITTFSIESLYKIVLSNIAKSPIVSDTKTMIIIDQ